MSDGPRIAALLCPTCGGALGASGDAVFRCEFCGNRSLLLDGTQIKVGTWRLPSRFDPAPHERHLRKIVPDQPVDLVERRFDRLYLARTGRIAARGKAIRHGVFGVPLDESDGDDLLELSDPTVLEVVGEAEAVDPTEALRHFDFRVLRAIGQKDKADYDTSWENDARIVCVPVVELSFEVDLPEHPDWKWQDARADRRYHEVVSAWDGRRHGSALPRRVWSDQKVKSLAGRIALVAAPFLGLAGGIGGLAAASFVVFLLICLVAWVLAMVIAAVAVVAPLLFVAGA